MTETVVVVGQAVPDDNRERWQHEWCQAELDLLLDPPYGKAG